MPRNKVERILRISVLCNAANSQHRIRLLFDDNIARGNVVESVYAGKCIEDKPLAISNKNVRRRLRDLMNKAFKLGQKYNPRSSSFQETLSWGVSMLGLNTRAQSALERANISSARALVELNEARLSMILGIGETSRYEIKRKLQEMGLSLGMDV